MVEFFEIVIFILKYILNHSKSIPIGEKLSKQFLSLPIFRSMAPIFRNKKRLSPERNHNGKIIEIVIFTIKYVFDHSELIPT